jgi:integrase
MVYSFARIGAVIQMKVSDYFVQGRRRWVRLHEKGGKEYDVPCHHRRIVPFAARLSSESKPNQEHDCGYKADEQREIEN